MRRVTGIFFILLVCLQASAQESVCSRRFLVAVNNYAPQFYRDSLNRPKGLTHELIEILQQRLGCVFIEKDLARPIANEQMKIGRVDLVGLILKNPEFDLMADFSTVYRAKRELIIQKSLYVPGKSLRDYCLDKKIVFGSVIGSHTALNPKEEVELRKGRRLLESVDVATLYDLLKKKRVQAMMMMPLTNSFYEKKLKLDDQVVRVVDETSSVQVGIYYSKRRISKTEKKQLEDALEAMRKDGSLVRLLSGYLPKESELVVSYRR